ncbi:MAG: DUF368 domain-containing protein [Bacilli bacterium]|nr:DUF368 domain-containing protein [Bacilli bacterium]
MKKKERKGKKNIKFDFNSVFGGMFVGIANIIPGVSGGTMLVIFNLFDRLMYAISDIFKKETTTRKESIILLIKVLISAAIGIILFAKLLGITLKYIEAETIFWFMGLIIFSVPIIIKQEMKGENFNIFAFVIGFSFIIILQYLQSKNPSNDINATMNVIHFISLILYGIIGGATMIFPGVSGSMVLLVLGKYEMIRSYIDKLTSLDMEAFISLCFFGIGVILGIVLSAKLTSFLLKKYKGKTVSVILGFIIASALILPFNIEGQIEYNTLKICSIIISFIFGGIIIYYINRLQTKKENA